MNLLALDPGTTHTGFALLAPPTNANRHVARYVDCGHVPNDEAMEMVLAHDGALAVEAVEGSAWSSKGQNNAGAKVANLIATKGVSRDFITTWKMRARQLGTLPPCFTLTAAKVRRQLLRKVYDDTTTSRLLRAVCELRIESFPRLTEAGASSTNAHGRDACALGIIAWPIVHMPTWSSDKNPFRRLVG